MIAHAKGAKDAKDAEDVSTLCQMSKCSWIHGRQEGHCRFDIMQNVEMRGWGKSGHLSQHITTLCQMSK